MSLLTEFPRFSGELDDEVKDVLRDRLQNMPSDDKIAKGLLHRYCGGNDIDAKYPASKATVQEVAVRKQLRKAGLLVKMPKSGYGTTREGLRVLAGLRPLVLNVLEQPAEAAPGC